MEFLQKLLSPETRKISPLYSAISIDGNWKSPFTDETISPASLLGLFVGSITTSMLGSFKSEMPQALHNFTSGTGNSFYAALIRINPSGTYDATTTNYTNVTASGDEVTGTGYTASGFQWTAGMNITPTYTAPGGSGSTSYWSWTTNPSWSNATFSTRGMIIFNSSSSQRGVAVFDFGGTQQVTSGTFTVILPTNNSTNAILRIQ